MVLLTIAAMIEAAVRAPFDYRAPSRLNKHERVSSRFTSSVVLDRKKSCEKSLWIRTPQLKKRIRASMESDPSINNIRYHPFEEIENSVLDGCGDATLTAQETARTIVEVNKKATLMLTGLISDNIHENIIWPDLPYVTDDHGSIYFQVKDEEDIMKTLTSDTNFVHAIIGFDTMEMINEMELIESTEIEYGIEEIDEEDEIDDTENDSEDDSDADDEEYITILGEEDDIEDDSDESVGDWAKLDTMRSLHPMNFAKKLAQVATENPIDWMVQPPSGLAVQGLIRLALTEERSDIQKRISTLSPHVPDPSSNGQESLVHELEVDVSPNTTSYYKLEISKVQLISPQGAQTAFDVEDFRKAQPDAVAMSASKIISKIKGSNKITEALRSLCLRCKGVHVDEAALIGIDSLGFDLRVCSGPQILSLRFAFNSRATSECCAERQLNELLYPKSRTKQQRNKQSRQN